MEPYRVQLDVYNGPLDLLLYLIRRDEVDIHDIPVFNITEQYCRHVEMLQQVDPNLAGEFLVMAATLLEIKTRMLLPVVAGGEGEAEQALQDPRADLVRQLLEYKAFKDAADQLRTVGQAQALRHPRHPVRPEFAQPELDLADVQAWHLLEAFGKVMSSIGKLRPSHEVIYDDTPLALHQEDLLDRLTRHQGRMRFQDVFLGQTRRLDVVGLFLAMLELIRQNRLSVQQENVFGDIYLFVREPDDPARPDLTDQPRGEDPMIAFNESPRGRSGAQPRTGQRPNLTIDPRPGLVEFEDDLHPQREPGADAPLGHAWTDREALIDALDEDDLGDDGELEGDDVDDLDELDEDDELDDEDDLDDLDDEDEFDDDEDEDDWDDEEDEDEEEEEETEL